jgi:hypothetical protein
MVNYTNGEMAHIHYVYGLADGNALRARRIYSERYPNRQLPNVRTFTRLHQRLVETGSFARASDIPGRPITRRTPALEEAVLNEIEVHPETSTRKIAADLNVSPTLVWTILREQQLYPYHIQRVQALLPRDFPQRLTFCRWILQKIAQNPQYIAEVLFTDEANFSRNAIMNFHNKHLWCDENPHVIIETHFQYQFSLNVWVGIVGDFLIGPVFLPMKLDGASYRRFLEDELPLLLEDVPLMLRNRMWFMHDGAPAHFSLAARQFLNRTFANRWIGRGAEMPNQPWPPRCPDLNPLDFFLWGHLKSLIYTAAPIQNQEDLRNRIVAGCETIRNTPGIFERVRQSMRRRAEACIMAAGGHFQQLL